MERTAIMAKAASVGARVLQGMGLELVNLELGRQKGGWFLRYFIDKPGGVTLQDCQAASRQLGVELDVEDLIPEHYTLEVSSPGLDRPLRTEAEFLRFLGKLVVIHSLQPVDGRRHFKGVLDSLTEGVVTIVDSDGRSWRIPMGNISKARLEVQF